MKISTKLIIGFCIIQTVELYIFNNLLHKAQQPNLQATAEPLQPETTELNTPLPAHHLEQKTAQMRAKTSSAKHAQEKLINTSTQENINTESQQQQKEESYDADTIDQAENEYAYYAASQALEGAITSGYWTEHNTHTILENKHKLTGQQLAEITVKFYMNLDGGKMQLQGVHPHL